MGGETMGDTIKSSARWILRRTLTPHTWEEKTQRPAEDPEAGVVEGQDATPGRRKSLAVRGTHESALVPTNDKLLVYRSLTGIDTVPMLTASTHTRRIAPNVGLFSRIVRAERLAARNYHVLNMLVNACLAIQFIIGASLTALGASGGSSSAVAAFGAINTIIAGILTYLKGSGLPERYRHVEDGFKTVREYAEQRERQFCLADCPLDPFDEVQTVDDLYRNATQQWSGGKNSGGGTPGSAGPSVQTAPGMVQGAVASLAHRFAKKTEPTHDTAGPAT
ncbi:hypothetical protein HIM_11687 [Hirsutella minnesotensis 3608]|uniref:SMODS and SLOG-associating 2TM effector domain-containing protein n=1 Tax=Hirsutella minnesotensis 3608 TaxID=1043627 RepID=A0A0F7ZIU9_9HYPO|nr:hypothetical protein HIM_11687 [Hirsutella minnesotensis 3608]